MKCFRLLSTILHESSISHESSFFEWHKRFQEGREFVRDDERCGRSKEVRTPQLIGQIKNVMDKDRRVFIETISAQFDVTQLFRNWRYGRFVPSLSQGCTEKIRKKDVVITVGRWSIQFQQFLMLWWPAMKAGSTAMAKRQSSQWKHKARQCKSTHRLLMITFFDSTGIIYMNWGPTEQTVKKEYSVEILREFRKRFFGKRPALFKSDQWHFHQDNAPVHNSIFVTDYLNKMGIKTVPHPPYSPDLVPCDFWLFPKLRGSRYETIEERKGAVTKVIDMLTQEDLGSCWNSTAITLQPEEITSKGTQVSCVYYQ